MGGAYEFSGLISGGEQARALLHPHLYQFHIYSHLLTTNLTHHKNLPTSNKTYLTMQISTNTHQKNKKIPKIIINGININIYFVTNVTISMYLI